MPMHLLPAELVTLDHPLLDEIDEKIKNVFRLIVFNKTHQATDLFSRYMEAVEHLRDVLSIKNAQQEAQSLEEAHEYLANLKVGLGLIVEEISRHHILKSPIDLFRLLRLIAPEAAQLHPNRFRDTHVQFGPCNGAPPGQIEQLVYSLFEQLPSIKHPVIRSFYLHHELIRIHPFADGNGRVSRMAKNWMLMFELYPPMFISGYADKEKYLSHLQQSFLSIDENPLQFHEATRSFFISELRRLKASIEFVYQRMVKNPTMTFDQAYPD